MSLCSSCAGIRGAVVRGDAENGEACEDCGFVRSYEWGGWVRPVEVEQEFASVGGREQAEDFRREARFYESEREYVERAG